jgi:calcineurin-like phosphoesterase family protein
MTVYFTSDQHFGHAAARGFYRRPFSSTADMDDRMIAHWNFVVSPIDELWHLGISQFSNTHNASPIC